MKLVNSLPNMMNKVFRFLKAWLRFKIHGSPRRSSQYVELLFQVHCSKCVHYDPDLKECSICECHVSPSVTELNKLSWATEECPDKRWRADEKG